VREIEVMSRLSPHPGITNLLDSFHDPTCNLAYLVIELCRGPDLAAVVRSRGALANFEVQGVARQLISVTAFIHSLDIVHRDIKPANLMLVEPLDIRMSMHDVHVKLGDFGFARRGRARMSFMRTESICHISSGTSARIKRMTRLHAGADSIGSSASQDETTARTIQKSQKDEMRNRRSVRMLDVARVGTPAYIAPELVTGAEDPGGAGRAGYMVPKLQVESTLLAAVDIYSIGATLYELMTGVNPRRNFAAHQKAIDLRYKCAICSAGKKPVLRHPSQLDPDAKRFLAMLLAAEPGKRPSAESAKRAAFLQTM